MLLFLTVWTFPVSSQALHNISWGAHSRAAPVNDFDKDMAFPGYMSVGIFLSKVAFFEIRRNSLAAHDQRVSSVEIIDIDQSVIIRWLGTDRFVAKENDDQKSKYSDLLRMII
ncbi:hypothetical protein B0A52_04159 [Exophiala mesophila]|uniref:Uncharacterized protein n=1 Tax=Exophiala mesophila TaxID=212818 RepID=A0A438NAF9_EXOME|nr:hypothetical protein B0A52_04159 [Exophiala mesophila]